MADKWSNATLRDVADILTGYPFKSEFYVSDVDAPRLLRGDNVAQGAIRWNGVKRWGPEPSEKIEPYWLGEGDVVLAMDRPWIEAGLKFALIREADFPALLVQRVACLRGSDRLMDGFLHYVVASREVNSRIHVLSVQTGTAVPHISGNQIGEYEFLLPSLPEQRTIAHILGTLDDKIELNRRMNETLEAMARALFKSWFVDFEPVRAKAAGRDSGLPQPLADLFPAHLADSDLGEIPEGWEAGTIAALSALNPETWTKGERPAEIRYIDLSNTKRGRIEAITPYAAAEAPSRAQRVLRPGDTIVGTVRPGNDSYALVSESGLTGSTGFAVLRPKAIEFTEFVYLAATSADSIDALAHLADGAAYPAVRPDVVAATPIVRPDDGVLTRFSSAAGALLRKMAHNVEESRTLVALRDNILPNLISGELRIKDGERLMERAV